MFEKAGVNISVVYGEMHEDQIKSMKSRGKDVSLEGKNTFFATGKIFSCEWDVLYLDNFEQKLRH